ncbi:hypothetical protein [Paenibacillus sp. Marseille-Q4541]|uniref:hypothetical protein n=1 Tax=Paenibacillus sp. Marseille-Q4541 TaxID=2831522 RepID=UPI001BAE24F6|nr:hypothetical protein [Paenibacillus sp. Marseille-Q4541]
MSKWSWYIFIAIVSLIIITGVVVDTRNARTSFQELVVDEIGDPHGSQVISSIYIAEFLDGENVKSITVTDIQTINKIMNVFAEIKLNRSDKELSISSSNYYKVMIQPDNGPSLDVNFNKDKIMEIQNSINIHKKYTWTYEVVNDFDYSLIEAMLH